MSKQEDFAVVDHTTPEEIVEELSGADMLDRLLSADPPQAITAQVRMKRLNGAFTVRAITYDQYSKLERQCQRQMKNTRTGKFNKQTDDEKLSLMLIVEACVNPNFRDPAVQKRLMEKFQVADVYDAIKKLLLIGEIMEISSKIFDISGFEEELEEIKN